MRQQDARADSVDRNEPVRDPESGLLIVVADGTGRLCDANDAALRGSGYARTELVGRTESDFFHADMPRALIAGIHAELARGRCWQGVLKARTRSGEALWLHANVSPQATAVGAPGRVYVSRPITSTATIDAAQKRIEGLKAGRLSLADGRIIDPPGALARRWSQVFRWRPRMAAQLAIAAAPLVLMIALFVAVTAHSLWSRYEQSDLAEATVGQWSNQLAFIQAIQQERGRSAGYAAAKDEPSRSAMHAAREQLDPLCPDATCAMHDAIAGIRVRVDDGSLAGASLLQEFTRLVAGELDTIAGEALAFALPEDQERAFELMERARLFEAIALERGTIQQFLGGAAPAARVEAIVAVRRSAISRTLALLASEEKAALDQALQAFEASTAPYRPGPDGSADPTVSRDAAFEAYTSAMGVLKALSDAEASAWLAASTARKQQALQSGLLIGVAIVLGLAVASVLGWRFQSRMLAGVRSISAVMQEVATKGDFHRRVNVPDTGDELSALCASVDLSLCSVQRSLASLSEVMAAVAAGDMQRRINDALVGDLDALRNDTNSAVASLDLTMQELQNVMEGLASGHLDVRLSGQIKGRLGPSVNQTLATLETSLVAISGLLTALGEGRFGGRIAEASQGTFGALERDVNAVSAALASAINHLSSTAAAMSQGRLDAQITVELRGELESLRNDLNIALRTLSEAVSLAKQTAGVVSGTSVELVEGGDQLNRRSQTQAASLEETAAAMEEIAASVAQTDEQAANASGQAANVKQLAEGCAASMVDLEAAMRRSLASSAAIEGAVQLIQSIAFQTNLLALNAAVEAARAGEQGRGFAVVATEVRALAQRASTGASQIRDLIQSARDDIALGSQRAGVSLDALNAMQAALAKLTEAVIDIARAAREQSSGIGQVNQVIMELDGITQQNAAMAEKSAASATGMQEQILRLTQVLDRLIV